MVLGEPWAYFENKSSRSQLSLKDQSKADLGLSGFSVDLVKAIGKELKIDFQLVIASNNSYGSKQQEHWTGIMGDLTSGAIDFSAAPLATTVDRAKSVEFVSPMMYLSGITVVTTVMNVAALYFCP